MKVGAVVPGSLLRFPFLRLCPEGNPAEVQAQRALGAVDAPDYVLGQSTCALFLR